MSYNKTIGLYLLRRYFFDMVILLQIHSISTDNRLSKQVSIGKSFLFDIIKNIHQSSQ